MPVIVFLKRDKGSKVAKYEQVKRGSGNRIKNTSENG